jgi:hypothetical protein
MSDQHLNTLRLRRFTAAQFALGRWLFNLRVHQRRLAWRTVGTGAQLAKRLLDGVGSLTFLIAFSPLFAAGFGTPGEDRPRGPVWKRSVLI